jgi:hypothetical protein
MACWKIIVDLQGASCGKSLQLSIPFWNRLVIEYSKKYVQKKKLRADLLQTDIFTSQGPKGSLKNHLKQALIIELSVKYVHKRKLRANFIKTRISTSKGAKSSLVVVLQQV